MFAAKDTLLTRPSGGYQISRSLRFNPADSARLTRTPASATNRQIFTWSGWVKRSALGSAYHGFFGASTGLNTYTAYWFNNDNLWLYSYTSGTENYAFQTTQLFRDTSAWYHLVIATDTTQATNTNRIKIYVNGSQVTAFSYTVYPTQNFNDYIDNNVAHTLGWTDGNSGYYSGYMTEINFIDGQQLTPSSFGSTNAQTGVWQPKAFSGGAYGTNGFYVNFSDNSNTTAATLGKDYSGNGNNWTPNNFSVTAGVGNDSFVDSPTSYGTDTGAGGTVRGNYATLNPVDPVTGTLTYVNGNLQVTFGASSGASVPVGTLAVTSGKWYWEVVPTGTLANFIGVANANSATNALKAGGQSGGYYYYDTGQRYTPTSSGGAYGASYTTNDVIGVALDMDAGTVTMYKNNTSQGVMDSNLSGLTIQPAVNSATSGSGVAMTFNFGQRPFAYTAPSGFKALCTQNLPTPTIGATSATLANKYFDINLWTGNGTSQTLTNSGGFQPDWVWTKGRSNADSNVLVNAVTGANQFLLSDSTQAEATSAALVSAFTSSGFSIGSSTSINRSSSTYVGWQWKANGAGSSNTSGSITSTVSASTTSGFSVVTYTGNATSNQTFGHGLGAKVDFAIIKSRSAVSSPAWMVWHRSVCSGNGKALALEETNAIQGPFGTPIWDSSNTSTQSSTTTFTIGANTTINASGATYVAYCFAEVAGYSKFGSYTGNGSTDGPFVFTGFRPAFVMVKRTDSTSDWYIWDTKRDTYNVVTNTLEANTSDAEASATSIDDLSNGFKCRSATVVNASGGTYIYMAFAEAPQKFSLAR